MQTVSHEEPAVGSSRRAHRRSGKRPFRAVLATRAQVDEFRDMLVAIRE